MAFTCVLLADSLWLFVEHLPRTQEKLERACLEHHRERSLKPCDW